MPHIITVFLAMVYTNERLKIVRIYSYGGPAVSWSVPFSILADGIMRNISEKVF